MLQSATRLKRIRAAQTEQRPRVGVILVAFHAAVEVDPVIRGAVFIPDQRIHAAVDFALFQLTVELAALLGAGRRRSKELQTLLERQSHGLLRVELAEVSPLQPHRRFDRRQVRVVGRVGECIAALNVEVIAQLLQDEVVLRSSSARSASSLLAFHL